MPVEFLTDAEAAAYGRFVGPPSRLELERFFFLDDADRRLVTARRGDHNRLGFALQLASARFLDVFLDDPLDVPGEVVFYLAGQLDIDDPACLARYAERRSTQFEHVAEIKTAYGLREFSEAQGELAGWIDARAWASGDSPKAIFIDAVGWLVERRVLLPGVSTLVRLVASGREQANQRLYETLAAVPNTVKRRRLEAAIDVVAGARSELERWSRGPTKVSGKSLEQALKRVREITALGFSIAELEQLVPRRRVLELARYGLSANARQLRRHPPARRIATLICTLAYLTASCVDDALELLDVLMVNELLARAKREGNAERLRVFPMLATASGLLARAWGALRRTVARDGQDPDTQITLRRLWEVVEQVATTARLDAAGETVLEIVPASPVEQREVGRRELANRIGTVRGFAQTLTETIEFGANIDAAPVLDAMRSLPALLRMRRRPAAGDIDAGVVDGAWQALVFGELPDPDGLIDRDSYVLCVLSAFHQALRRGEIYADASTRWRDPAAHLLAGDAWQGVKGTVLEALQLPENPEQLLADRAEELDLAYRDFVAGLAQNSSATVDEDGRLHVKRLDALPDPPSLIDLRNRVAAMLPRVDLPEVILEVMAWQPGMVQAFSATSGAQPRLEDLHVTVAACLAAQALNVGYEPIVDPGVPALSRDRISHVTQNYMGADAYTAANRPLIDAQAGIPLARSWGGGLVAAVDGMRFVVPVPSIYARPNRKYFGSKRGVTWLNMINDQAAGLGAKVISGAPRDTLHMIDVAFTQNAGRRVEVIVSDTGSYSDLTFGIVHLLDREYRPALADMPDQRLWRTDPKADYGPLNQAARGRIDLELVRRHWPEILRLIASIYTGTITAYDAVRMLQHGGSPTALGQAIASYGRIFKSLHVLAFAADDESYRRDIKGIRNLQEGRHALAETTFHGRKGELRQRYYQGMEDQLGALGLVLNCIVLWNTRYMNAALEQLHVASYPMREEDIARLSPFLRRHINMHGKYSFLLPDLAGMLRTLRDPDSPLEDLD